MNSPSNKAVPFVPDTAVFLQNCRDFTARFPEQAALLSLNTDDAALQRLRTLPPEYRLIQTRASKTVPTLLVHNTYLHSQYNPQEEARRILHTDFFQTREIYHCCIFAGLGLGYLPEQYINSFPDSHAVMIEPDTAAFLCFLASRSLAAIFQRPHVSLLVGVPPETVMGFLTAIMWNKRILFQQSASAGIHKEWYDSFSKLIERDNAKMSTNAATLERFGMLWLKNTMKNIEVLSKAAKITCFKNAFAGAPAVVLAGGPSLTAHLELIKECEPRFVIIAVDTALRACVRAGVQPDFILSFDPQYWNYLHTANMAMQNAILISEAAVFPAILRQSCRAVFLSDSSVPFARYLEQPPHSETSGEDCILAAGGSVATTAWDFARFIGASPIIMAGLDLAYPNKQTHFTGSTFEEAVHTCSSRFNPAEAANVKSLIEAYPTLHADYNGGMVLTDRRMLLYAWWFENAFIKYPETKTYNLMPQGLVIPGLPAYSAEQFAQLAAHSPSRAVIAEQLCRIINFAYSADFTGAAAARKQRITASLAALTQETAFIAAQAEQAAALCSRFLESYQSNTATPPIDRMASAAVDRSAAHNVQEPTARSPASGTQQTGWTTLMQQLDLIDERISQNFTKEFISVLFFNTGKEEKDQSGSGMLHSIAVAQKTYEHIRQLALHMHKIYASAEPPQTTAIP